MLSRSIYNLNRTLERDYEQGEGVSDNLHRSLIDVLGHWHKMALDMELELEAYHSRQDQMTAGEVVPVAKASRSSERKLRLVVDNSGCDK